MHDVAIIGAGMAGMATAARLQAMGLSTIVFEAHGQAGGCAGFYRRAGFSFDVGATTLVDFESGVVGGEMLERIGMPVIPGEPLPGYMAWLPDRTITLHRDPQKWRKERSRLLGDTPAHRRFWKLLDRLADVFWRASRRGVKLPLRSSADVTQAIRAVGLTNLPAVRYLNWTMGDALHAHRLRGDKALVGLLGMLIEDTVHSTVDEAPLVNAALGITIRGAGLTRATGGMRGFWQAFVKHYGSLGGQLHVGCPVTRVTGRLGEFLVETRRGAFPARQVVSAVPMELTARLAPQVVGERLKPFLRRDAPSRGGAVVVFLGVPEVEVSGQQFTHHQLLHDYATPLGNGNNMFVSVSAAGDTASAPTGFRTVMLSTHCDLKEWRSLSPQEYREQKTRLGQRLIALARRVYPRLGMDAKVFEAGTPRTYERFTHRPEGAVGGVRQTLGNANQNSVPHDIGVPGFRLVGDTTWPGLGTVACVLGSQIVAEGVIQQARRLTRISPRSLDRQVETPDAHAATH
ncbi:phytoene desaturase family protein [Lignipirellula cremea]|uniref:Phytoene desaturase (Lycopene-forming) n=1 Tax=Lignipirellula cremea TaxID=2528010 RepID=A0A518DWR1_9BACT|nr:FAD-dependent oxidoreductase [Lignipirellula cremea]QDU96270.1 Phytoene desaturase (lycopene-forming) [Lignipirellula cremea]